MALREIRLDGDEILRKISKPVKKIDDKLIELVEDMKETLKDADGAGLAAVQVGVLKRLFLVDVGDEHGLVIFINPTIEEEEGEQVGLEGCLSVPDHNGIVRRANKIRVRYYDMELKEQELVCEGFFARAVQHEYDHINGKLYKDAALVMDPTEEDYPEYFGGARKRGARADEAGGSQEALRGEN